MIKLSSRKLWLAVLLFTVMIGLYGLGAIGVIQTSPPQQIVMLVLAVLAISVYIVAQKIADMGRAYRVADETQPQKIDWKEKLSSRTFWMSVIAFLTMILTYAGVSADQTQKITELILSAVGIVLYILGEGVKDGLEGGTDDEDEIESMSSETKYGTDGKVEKTTSVINYKKNEAEEEQKNG